MRQKGLSSKMLCEGSVSSQRTYRGSLIEDLLVKLNKHKLALLINNKQVILVNWAATFCQCCRPITSSVGNDLGQASRVAFQQSGTEFFDMVTMR